MMKPGTLDGAMPAKLLLNMRPNAAAGFANDVDAVNQYAAPMYAATTMIDARPAGARRMTSNRPAARYQPDTALGERRRSSVKEMPRHQQSLIGVVLLHPTFIGSPTICLP
jgi:hypothetical protein